MNAKLKILVTLLGLIINAIFWIFPNEGIITILIIWSTGAFLGASILMFLIKKQPLQISLFFSLGFLIALLLKIIYDTTFIDSTSHNLAGIAIILCVSFTIPFAIAGSFLVKIFILLANHKFKQAFLTMIIVLVVVLMIAIPVLLMKQKSNFQKKIKDKTLDTTQVIELYKKANKKGDIKAISTLSVHPNLPDSIQEKLSNSEIIDIRKSIAYDTDSEEILRKLAVDKEWEVRLAVAINKLTPIEILDNLQNDTNEDVRNIANSVIQQRKIK